MISRFWPWGNISSDKPRVLIFGTGAGGNNFYKRNRRRYRVLAFLDNNRERQGQSLFGKKILPPEMVRSISFDKIIIASDYFREILPQLLSYGVRDIDILVLKEYDHDNNAFKDRLVRYLTAAICRHTCRHVGLVSRFLLSGLAQRVLRAPYIELKRAEILWLDNAAAYKICEFRPEMDCNVQPPRFVGTDLT